MRQVRYSVAMSLDGYIAGPEDESDWILMDPDIDFRTMMNSFDTVLMGRRTFETASANGGGTMPGMKVIVVSRTLRQEDYPNVTIINGSLEEAILQLRSEPGKDIWLFGGGLLFRSLLDSERFAEINDKYSLEMNIESVPALCERFGLTFLEL